MEADKKNKTDENVLINYLTIVLYFPQYDQLDKNFHQNFVDQVSQNLLR